MKFYLSKISKEKGEGSWVENGDPLLYYESNNESTSSQAWWCSEKNISSFDFKIWKKSN